MSIEKIRYGKDFMKYANQLPKDIRKKMLQKILYAVDNPLHPSLRMHKLSGKLSGLWALSIDKKHRVLFQPMDDGGLYLVSVGKHSIYENQGRKG